MSFFKTFIDHFKNNTQKGPLSKSFELFAKELSN